jgi:hypothetical protein
MFCYFGEGTGKGTLPEFEIPVVHQMEGCLFLEDYCLMEEG